MVWIIFDIVFTIISGIMVIISLCQNNFSKATFYYLACLVLMFILYNRAKDYNTHDTCSQDSVSVVELKSEGKCIGYLVHTEEKDTFILCN